MKDEYNISNAKYVAYKDKNVSVSCTINGRFRSVPLDPNNTRYAEILRRVKAGTLTIEDAD